MNKKLLLGLTSILALGMFIGRGLVTYAIGGDAGSDYVEPNEGCTGRDSCWLSLGTGTSVYGIRVSVVDGNGKLVSSKSMDYLGNNEWTKKINRASNILRVKETSQNKINRLAYLIGDGTVNMSLHDGSTIAKTWTSLPNVYNKDADKSIKNKIINMTEEELTNTFFNDINYNPKNGNAQNHYMIIEPLTVVSANGGTVYYGTYYELTRILLEKNWIKTAIKGSMPLSMFVEGNPEIKGSGGYNNGTYFNGILEIVKNNYLGKSQNGKTIVKDEYVKNGKIGYGIGIFWMGQLVDQPKCEFGNITHFASTTSGPDGIDCCAYVLDNITDYNITKAELFSTHPRCGSFPTAKSCPINIGFEKADCDNSDNTIKISDKSTWECIFESAYSYDNNWATYFLEAGKITDPWSISCEYEITLEYPYGDFQALAGNHFTISKKPQSSASYSIDTNPEIPVITPASLGSITSKVTKHCRINGEINANSKDAVKGAVENINAPTLEFKYDSEKYKGKTEMELAKHNSTITYIYNGSRNFERTLTTYHILPQDTFKYVTSDGTSYREIDYSEIGLQNYINIGPHAPIHFGETKINGNPPTFTITIKDFGIEKYNKYIKDGEKIKKNYEPTIETFINSFLEELSPVNKNGIWYFNDSFTKLLFENPQRAENAFTDFTGDRPNLYSITDFLSMDCADTSDYSCSSDANGIYCLIKGTNQNNEDIYTNAFTKCIDNKVKAINQKYAETDFQQDLNYTCDFEVVEGNGNPDINVIFRQISLNNPFPGNDGSGRNVGINWSFGEDSSPDNEVVKKVIKNNREVETEKIYKELDPLYKITLTPSLIKRIREYNKDNPYVVSDENIADNNQLDCNPTTGICLSPFIRDDDKFKNEFSGCGITNASVGLTCASNEGW